MSQTEPLGMLAPARPAALELELEAIDRQQRRFSRLSLLAIVVSFVHMAAALALFSGVAWYELGAALAMTALVDVATWALAGYFDYAARRRLARSVWIKATFGFALAISMFLNGAYLYANRPPSLPGWMSVGIAGAFAVFVPMLIGVASLIRGELEDDRLRLQQQQASLAPVVNVAEPGPKPSRTRPHRGELPAFANTPPVGSRTMTAAPIVTALTANGLAIQPGLAGNIREQAPFATGELPAFAKATPDGSRTVTTPPVVTPHATNGAAVQPELTNGVRQQASFASGEFAAPSANSATASAVNGTAGPFANDAAVSERIEPGSPHHETPLQSEVTNAALQGFANPQSADPMFANAGMSQGFANPQSAGPVFANGGTTISTNDVPAIVAALRAANVHTFANARTLARICGWTSSSSGPKALKQLLAAGAVRETAGGFALVEPGSEPPPGALAEPLAPASI